MKKLTRVLCVFLMLAIVTGLFALQAYALDESEVQAQVDAVGKETVTGNLLIWFMCAIAFLKVSQKIDSILSGLGFNVGRPGGSLLMEAMIAARGVSGMRGNHSSHSGNSNPGSGSASAYSGGLAGIVGRQITKSAVNSVTSTEKSTASSVGGSIYASSAAKGGAFANSVIGSVATGSINTMGTITGEKAAQAMSSYMGLSAMEPGAKDVPSYSNVEIGGGRITGTETSGDHPEGIAFGMYHTDQYAAPEGDYETVYTADGASWYKQYAVEAVKKTPYKTADDTIAYQESLIHKLPPMPKRKDRL